MGRGKGAERCGEERPKVTRGQTTQLLGGCVEEFGLYYKSNGKPQTGLKQRNVTIYCVLKRSLQLHSREGLKKTLLGGQMGVGDGTGGNRWGGLDQGGTTVVNGNRQNMWIQERMRCRDQQ